MLARHSSSVSLRSRFPGEKRAARRSSRKKLASVPMRRARKRESSLIIRVLDSKQIRVRHGEGPTKGRRMDMIWRNGDEKRQERKKRRRNSLRRGTVCPTQAAHSRRRTATRLRPRLQVVVEVEEEGARTSSHQAWSFRRGGVGRRGSGQTLPDARGSPSCRRG